MTIVGAQSGQWEMDKANPVAAAMLSEHPDLKALLCGNDSMALGAVAAVKAAGRTGQVLVVGYDNIGADRARSGRAQCWPRSTSTPTSWRCSASRPR